MFQSITLVHSVHKLSATRPKRGNRQKVKYAKDIMSRPVTSVDPEMTIQKSAQVMSKKNIGSVTVMLKEKLVGILTERDISEKIVAKNKDASSLKVKEIMQSPVTTAKIEATIYEISTIMSEGGFRRVPIIKGGKLVGIVTKTDVEMALHMQAIEDLKTKVNELEIFNKMAIGRELKMVDLKKKIKDLEGKQKMR